MPSSQCASRDVRTADAGRSGTSLMPMDVPCGRGGEMTVREAPLEAASRRNDVGPTGGEGRGRPQDRRPLDQQRPAAASAVPEQGRSRAGRRGDLPRALSPSTTAAHVLSAPARLGCSIRAAATSLPTLAGHRAQRIAVGRPACVRGAVLVRLLPRPRRAHAPTGQPPGERSAWCWATRNQHQYANAARKRAPISRPGAA